MRQSDLYRRPPDCPRCGYDLRGTCAAWHDQCPIDGRCVECGLVFAWRDIFIEAGNGPSWCVEFAPPGRVPRAAVATFARTFVPWRFWSALRMTHLTRPRRLVVYGLLLAVTCAVLLVSANATVVSTDWGARFGPGSGSTNTMSVVEATARTILLPLSDEPLGTVTRAPGFTSPNYSPLDLMRSWRAARYAFLYAVIGTLLGPLVLTGLVASRRRAGILPRHLTRAYAYSLGCVPLMFAGGLAMMLPYYSDWFALRAPMRWLVLTDYVMMFVFPVFVLLWWQAAIRRYLHMEHSWAVAVAIMVLSLGGALIFMVAFDDRSLEHVFERLWLL